MLILKIIRCLPADCSLTGGPAWCCLCCSARQPHVSSQRPCPSSRGSSARPQALGRCPSLHTWARRRAAGEAAAVARGGAPCLWLLPASPLGACELQRRLCQGQSVTSSGSLLAWPPWTAKSSHPSTSAEPVTMKALHLGVFLMNTSLPLATLGQEPCAFPFANICPARAGYLSSPQHRPFLKMRTQ